MLATKVHRFSELPTAEGSGVEGAGDTEGVHQPKHKHSKDGPREQGPAPLGEHRGTPATWPWR